MDYNAAIANDICILLAGGRRLRDIAAMPIYPSVAVIRRWQRSEPQFATALAQATKDRAAELVDDLDDVVDDLRHMRLDASQANAIVKIKTWQAERMDRDTWGRNAEIQATVPVNVVIQGKEADL